jgi:hypothetical protein
MLKKDSSDRLKAAAANAAELALQLAGDRRFRERLGSAAGHGARAGLRAQRWLGTLGTLTRLASDQALQMELRAAQTDLQRALARAGARRRRRLIRKLALLVALSSILAISPLRKRLSTLLTEIKDSAANSGGNRQDARSESPQNLEDLTRDELYARAQAADIPGRSEMSKADLVAALRADDPGR